MPQGIITSCTILSKWLSVVGKCLQIAGVMKRMIAAKSVISKFFNDRYGDKSIQCQIWAIRVHKYCIQEPFMQRFSPGFPEISISGLGISPKYPNNIIIRWQYQEMHI